MFKENFQVNCYLLLNIARGNISYFHGRRSSKGFGGAPNFCPKKDIEFCPKSDRFFYPNFGDLQKKKRSSLFTELEMVFLFEFR